MRQVIKWIIAVLFLTGGCWGLVILYSSTLGSAKVYRPELDSLVAFAKVLAVIFAMLIIAVTIQTIRRTFSPRTVSLFEHSVYASTFGLALGFLMAGWCVSKGPGFFAVMAILNYPSTFLALGWFSLGFGPHGDAGWNVFFWMPVLQWFLTFVIAYSIWLRKRKNTAKIAPGAKFSAFRITCWVACVCIIILVVVAQWWYYENRSLRHNVERVHILNNAPYFDSP